MDAMQCKGAKEKGGELGTEVEASGRAHHPLVKEKNGNSEGHLIV